MILIVFGLPGSGKSYFALKLASMVNAVYINSDRVRKEMLSKRTYSDKEKLSVYEQMLSEAIKVIKHNNVVLDATFYKREIRENFISNIDQNELLAFIEVVADEALVRERMQKKREDSEADFEVYKKIKEEWEPMDEPHLVLTSTNDNIDEMLHKTREYLHLQK
ncbi:AAA family ATPase [Segetibacter koreensis]|uniref:AAA family ATPase n=1 Tax=Segetibacter koreensis TaxID=398037 RepID=UPI000360411A|nr:AAA family ATPase [Segetibacter koreensis]